MTPNDKVEKSQGRFHDPEKLVKHAIHVQVRWGEIRT